MYPDAATLSDNTPIGGLILATFTVTESGLPEVQCDDAFAALQILSVVFGTQGYSLKYAGQYESSPFTAPYFALQSAASTLCYIWWYGSSHGWVAGTAPGDFTYGLVQDSNETALQSFLGAYTGGSQPGPVLALSAVDPSQSPAGTAALAAAVAANAIATPANIPQAVWSYLATAADGAGRNGNGRLAENGARLADGAAEIRIGQQRPAAIEAQALALAPTGPVYNLSGVTPIGDLVPLPLVVQQYCSINLTVPLVAAITASDAVKFAVTSMSDRTTILWQAAGTVSEDGQSVTVTTDDTNTQTPPPNGWYWYLVDTTTKSRIGEGPIVWDEGPLVT